MAWFIALLFSLFIIVIIVGGAYMHDAIDWYTEPKETELEKRVKNIKERYKWLRLNMGE